MVNDEFERRAVFYKDRDRATKMAADTKRAMQRREVEDLVRFVKTPTRPSKSATLREIDALTDVLKKKSAANDAVAVFDNLVMPTGKGEPHV